MGPKYFISVDGGGTQCRTRLVNKEGRILASLTGDAANIWSDFTGAMTRTARLMDDTLRLAGLNDLAKADTHAVLGLAGANVRSARQQAQAWPQDFARWTVLSDVETACLGAHQGTPGAVLITGTGSQGAIWNGKTFHCIGGWGLTLSDQGSGALLGREALRLALQAHEGLVPSSPLTQALMAHFDDQPEVLLTWATTATPAQWGQFAPQIFAAAQQEDTRALELVQACAAQTTRMIHHLTDNGRWTVALMGGLAVPIHPWLDASVRRLIVAPQGDALSGALQLALTSG